MDENDHLRKTLEHYRQQRQHKLDEVQLIENMIRQLERDLGEQPTVEGTAGTPDAGASWPGLHPMNFIKPDEFYGLSQSDAAKAYLRKVGHAVPFEELVTALRKGGAKLGGVDPKKTLYVSLARNPRKEFVWPSTDHISLSEFYEGRK
jgi:hypothetical protein